MSETFKKTVARLPEIVARNAGSMMQRMVQAMQQEIASDLRFEKATACTLVLKVASDHLVREFDLAVRAAMDKIKSRAGKPPEFSASNLTLEVEPTGPDTVAADLHGCTVAFRSLCAKADLLDVDGVDAFNKEVLLAAVEKAFRKARVEPEAASAILPYARRALNAELLNLYRRLEAL